MKKAIMCFIGAMMVLSLAACTPTTEKNKTGEVREPLPTESADYSKNPDPTAPDLEVVSIYTVSEDGSKMEGTMDAVEELSAESLAELLVQYGTLEEGTEVIDFTTEGEAASAVVGPGAAQSSDEEGENTTKEYATLNLTQLPEDEMFRKAVARTYLENMNIVYLTILVDGDLAVENWSEMDVD